MSLPLIANVCFTVLGWGPAVTVFWWERRVASQRTEVIDWSWRHVSIQRGRLEVTLQWL